MPDTAEDFQKMFDDLFPDGAVVTFLRSGNGDYAADDDPQVFVLRLNVLRIDNEHPEVMFIAEGTLRNYVLDLDEIEPRDYGLYITTAEDRQPALRISNRLTEAQRTYARSFKEPE